MRVVFVVLLSLVCWKVAAQDDEMECIMRFIGVSSPEDVDVNEAEMLSDLLHNPLKINLASVGALESSGLFSRFQVAALTDYRNRFGGIMSWLELSSVDGFTPAFVEVLSPFVSLIGGELEGWSGGPSVDGEVAVRTAAKWTDEVQWNYGVKSKFDVGRRVHVAFGLNRPYTASEVPPEDYSVSVQYDFHRVRGKLLVGDFNARFGQGLSLWNASFMSGLDSPDTFMKKPSGLSRCWSYNGSSAYSGVGSEFWIGQFTLSTLVAANGLKDVAEKPDKLSFMPAVNLLWRTKYGHVSTTHFVDYAPSGLMKSAASSADFALCVRGVNVFGEAAYSWNDGQYKILAGTDFCPGGESRMAVQMRHFAKEVTGLSWAASFGSGYSLHKGTVSLDAVCYDSPKGDEEAVSHQARMKASWEWQALGFLKLKLRADERFRTWGQPFRTSLRAELLGEYGLFCANVRADALWCKKFAAAGYVEGGYRAERVSAYLRQGFFHVDNWDDRIYVYERDIPGSFTGPAMYGRGLWTSAMVSFKASRALKFSARCSYTAYYKKVKPGKAELKLYAVLKF